MEVINLLIVFIVGMVAGSYGTLVGGGAFIVIPALIFMGLPAHIAIGTNRFAGVGMALGGWYIFHKKRLIDYRLSLYMVAPALVGSVIGSKLVFQFDEGILKQIIAVLTIAILALVFFQPNLGINPAPKTITSRKLLLAAFLFFIIYIYIGFYGAGGGTFLTYVLVLLLGQTFIESAANNKIATLAGALASVTVFANNQAIHYFWGTALFSGCFAGAYLGGHLSERIGNVWIKRLFFMVALIMSLKLLY